MTWTREHDRILAARCENLRIMDPTHVEHRERGGEAGWHDRVPLDHYDTDIAACIRAAEAWRKQDSYTRAWGLSVDETEDGGLDSAWTKFLLDGEDRWDRTSGAGETAAALAWALWEAVK